MEQVRTAREVNAPLAKSKGDRKVDPKEVAALDQAAKLLQESFPPMLWGFYNNCVEEGFTKPEAFELTKVWLFETRKGTK